MMKKMLPIVLIVALLTMVAPASAFASTEGSHTTMVASVQPNSIVVRQSQLSSQAIHFMKTMEGGLFKEFVLIKGHIALASPLTVLQVRYQLNTSDTQFLQSILAFDQQKHVIQIPSTPHRNIINPLIFTRGSVVYFTHDDIGFFLFAAASIGPVAMEAALEGVATMFGGPIGAAIGLIVGIIGGPSLASFSYRVIGAWFNNEGVYICMYGNWWWPYINSGTW